jgi:hypothetical protein
MESTGSEKRLAEATHTYCGKENVLKLSKSQNSRLRKWHVTLFAAHCAAFAWFSLSHLLIPQVIVVRAEYAAHWPLQYGYNIQRQGEMK